MANIALIVDNILSDSGVPITYSTSGTGGTSGVNGTSGTSGSSGTSATSGSSGTSGTKGTSGTSGANGTAGTSGTSGSSGTSGTSGSSGTSGTAGSSGTSPTGLVASNYLFRAIKNASQTITAGSDQVVVFVDDVDPNGWFASNRFQPTIAGYYNVNTQIWWDAASITNAQSNIQFRKNGSTQTGINQTQLLSGNGYAQQLNEIVYFNGTTDYLEVTAYTSNTTSQNINTSGTGSYFEASLIVGGGTSGTSGTSGSSGTSASSGSSGTAGTSGSSGTSGTSGSSGTSGTKGTSGTSGTSGSSGTAGTSGSSGTSAANGTSGTSGTNGSSGTSGVNATAGTSGVSGSSGTSGANGAAGSSGTSGTKGTSGTSGANGAAGSSGTSGTKGTSGTAGANGANGSSGTSGSSGAGTISGTTNYVAKFTASTTIGNSLIYDDGTSVGVGTTAPSYRLDVQVNNSTFTSRIMNLNTTTDNAGLIVRAGVNAGNEIILLENAAGTDRFAVFANGQVTMVGVNTTGTPILNIAVSGSGAFQRGVRMLNSGMAAGDSLMYATGQSDGSKNMGQFYFYYAGAASNSNRLSMGLHSVDDVFNIFGSSNVTIGTTSDAGYKLYVSGTIYATGDITASSDARYKTNIRPIENALEKIVSSRGVMYDRVDEESFDNVGFIAQELEVYFPELVSTDNKGYKGVKYQNAVAVLFEGIKEQQKQIEELKTLIDGFTK